MNRNYFERPIQGNGRDHQSYGRTGPFAPYKPSMPWGAIGLGLLVGAVIMWVIR